MTKYAANTTVSTDASRSEIEKTLRRYGADAFMCGTEGARAFIRFRMGGRQVMFVLTLPDPAAEEFNSYKQGGKTWKRADGVPEKMWEQACRQKWRALALVIKAKLEAVSAGITTVEDEFLAHTILGDGRTVGEAIKPQLDEHYKLGGPPMLMLGHAPK